MVPLLRAFANAAAKQQRFATDTPDESTAGSANAGSADPSRLLGEKGDEAKLGGRLVAHLLFILAPRRAESAQTLMALP